MTNINKIVMASRLLPNGISYCTSIPNARYCQEINTTDMTFAQSMNVTAKNCMEDVLVYIYPDPAVTSDNRALINVQLSYFYGM